MTRRNVVVIGASAGGVPLLRALLAGLEGPVEASLFFVLHRTPDLRSELVDVIARHSVIEVREPKNGETLARGVGYLAPADRHMRIQGRQIIVDRGPKEHHTRPAIDPLFISAAKAYGERAIGVLLSGNLSDGVAGLVAIKRQGGLSLVQDPREAEWPSMPRNALLDDHVDLIFQSAALPKVLRKLIAGAPVEEVVERREP